MTTKRRAILVAAVLILGALRGCSFFSLTGANAGASGSAGATFGGGSGGLTFNTGVPRFVIPFERSPIAQPGVHPGLGP